MSDITTKYNVSEDTIRTLYDYFNTLENVVAYEVTFTVAPGRCNDINEIKKKIMAMCVGRTWRSKPCGFYLVRENHKNGWPHIHGVIWYPSYADNALTLQGGRIFVERQMYKSKYPSKTFEYNELGKTTLFPLRQEPYEVDGEAWGDWFHYTMKDQNVKWRNKNVISWKSNLELFSFIKVDTDIVE